MTSPGLHPLQCSRCGAPLDPTYTAKGSVVTCEHCKQPHLWIAPNVVEPQRAPAAPQPRRSAKAVAVAGVAIAVALVLAGIGAALFAASKGRSAPTVRVSADMPLAIGDSIHQQIDDTGCEVDVVGLLPDGRVQAACGDTVAPRSRDLLQLDAAGAFAYAPLDPGDVVLVRTEPGWVRRIVVSAEPDHQVRVRAAAEPTTGGTVVPGAAVARVRRRTAGATFYVPLPDHAPLEPGDLVWFRDGSMLQRARVEELDGADVQVRPGYARSSGDGRFDAFEPSAQPAVTRSRASLLADGVRAPQALPPKSVVLVFDGTSWSRRTVAVDDGDAVELTRPDGKLEAHAKEDMVLVRGAR
jgi:hypothetical protein